MKITPQNGSRQMMVHVNPAATRGAPPRSLKAMNRKHPSPTRAAIELKVISFVGVSVERSTLMWIGRMIHDRYLKKDNPTGIICNEPAGRRAPADRLITSSSANTPTPLKERFNQVLRSLRP